MANNETPMQSQVASLRNLEIQMGQLASDTKSRPYRALPSTEVPKSDGKEQCKALTLRSGKHCLLLIPMLEEINMTLTREEKEESQLDREGELDMVVVSSSPAHVNGQLKET